MMAARSRCSNLAHILKKNATAKQTQAKHFRQISSVAKYEQRISNLTRVEQSTPFKKENVRFYNTRHQPLNNVKRNRFYSSTALPPHEIIKLPNLSPTMETGTIVSWEKEEGDRIEEGEVLALIETDKSTMEMETPEEGWLARIFLPGGSKDVPVNTLIAIIVSEEEDIAKFKDYTGEVADDSPPPATEATPPPTPVQTEAAPIAEAAPVAPTPTASTTGRVFASPLAKRIALERGIDINKVPGSGPRGRITIEDVESFKSGGVVQPAVTQPPPIQHVVPTPPPPPPPTAGATYTDIDLSSMRKTIAKRLTESKQTVPHYYLSVDVVMDNVVALRQQLNSSSNGAFKLSLNDFIIKASAKALKKVPECNSQWMTDYIREFHNVDISVAVSTEGGLITPIVFNADQKGLSSINGDVATLAEKARNKTIQPHEFVGGTFTISNLGMFGITNFSAVINPPQSCILAVGGTSERIIPDASTEQGFRAAKMMSVTLSCDHRVVDGAVGAQWLKEFRSYLENPITMLL